MVRKEIDSYGDIYYYNEKGQYHREDGPAVEYTNGSKWWYIDNNYHSADGPAIEHSDGAKYYYIMNKQYSYEEWLSIKDFPLLW